MAEGFFKGLTGLSIPSKVFVAFAIVLMTFGAVTAFGVLQLRRVGEGLTLVSQAYHPLTRLGAQLESSYRNSEQATARLLDETDLRTRRALLYLALDYHPRAAIEKVTAARLVVRQARALPAGETEGPFLDRLDGLLETIQKRYETYAEQGEDVRRVLDELERAPPDERSRMVSTRLEPSVRALKAIEQGIGTGLRDYSAEVDARINMRVRASSREERQGVVLVVVFAALAIGVGLGVTVLTQRLLSPIRALTDAVKAVGEGRFAGVAVRSDDELGLLSREFNEMQKRLSERERELQEKTQELLRSERLAAVGRLAAQITHEIRNPLSSISLNAELLTDELDDGSDEAKAEARAILRAMEREVDRLTEITEGYLRFARLPKPAPVAVELNEAVADLLDFMRLEFEQGQVSLERTFDARAPWVHADRAQLRQVLVNILRNAREAAGAGGRVVVTTFRETGSAGVVVEDTGPGFGALDEGRVFEPFFTTKERGTGLGLALVQEIVHEHGGRLELGVGAAGGARVRVVLPVVQD